jgi:hypothetical protein
MQQQLFTNNSGVPLSMAVWLADDTYDFVDEPNYISATELIKSPRQIILARRAGATDPETADISSRMPSAMGNAVHNAIENAWVERYKENMAKLGFSRKVIDRVRVNPGPEDMFPGIIAVYLEQRSYRKVGKYTVGGKFDFVGDGTIEDFKTTGVFAYISGSNDWKYCLQGSIYRWLNPDLITSDYIGIDFQFTDWSKRDAIIRADKGYPPTRIWQYKVRLKSIPETEAWVRERVALIERLEHAPESTLPLCEFHDLWQDPPKYKYYKNPANRNRSTKNFDTLAEANVRLIQDGSVGVVIEVPGQVKACKYCDAFDLCSQKDALLSASTLKL